MRILCRDIVYKNKPQNLQRRRRHRTMGFHVNSREKKKKGPFFATVINIPFERLRAKPNHKEDICSARPHGHKTSTGSSDHYKPSRTVAWHPVCALALSWSPPGWRVLLPSPFSQRQSRRRAAGDQGAGVRGERREGRRDGGMREAAQAHVASWLSTGISLPQPPSPYCW